MKMRSKISKPIHKNLVEPAKCSKLISGEIPKKSPTLKLRVKIGELLEETPSLITLEIPDPLKRAFPKKYNRQRIPQRAKIY